MAENQKDSVKKSFWQRNLFLLIILTLVIVVGGTYLYQNNILSFSLSSQSTENNEKEELTIDQEIASLDTNSQALQEKVDRLETLILELAQNVQNIPEPQVIQPAQDPTPVVLSNEDAYELIISINQIIINICIIITSSFRFCYIFKAEFFCNFVSFIGVPLKIIT